MQSALPIPKGLSTQPLEAVCCGCSRPLGKETRGAFPEGQLSWRVSHLSHYFWTKRDADVLDYVFINLKVFFKKLNSKVSSCKQGPLLALPPDSPGKSIQSP